MGGGAAAGMRQPPAYDVAPADSSPLAPAEGAPELAGNEHELHIRCR